MRIPGYDLEGWKEIAVYLRCSEGTVKRRARHHGLPHVVTTMGRIHASKAALDAWARTLVLPPKQ